MSSLDDLRRRINELDRQILELVGKRQETSREIIRAKRATGHATRDYNREREVLLAAREAGKQYGCRPQVAENILRLLIRSSLTTQEQASVAAQGAGSGRTRAGHRRRRQDGPLVCGVHGFAGIRGGGRGPGGRAAGIRAPCRLARLRR